MVKLSPYKIYQTFWKCLDYIYPPSCAACSQEGSLFCPECQSQVNEIGEAICTVCGEPQNIRGICNKCRNDPPPFTAVRSYAKFAGPLRKSLHSLKYQNNLAVGEYWSRKLIPIIEKCNWTFDYVLPVPISKQKRRERGYNQAALIARPIALYFHAKFSDKLVYLLRETQSQVNLSQPERFKNLYNAFQGNSATLNHKKVLLVDDTTTSGATLISCSKALQESGCERIYCITVAKTPKYHQ